MQFHHGSSPSIKITCVKVHLYFNSTRVSTAKQGLCKVLLQQANEKSWNSFIEGIWGGVNNILHALQ
jgi:hypothetical protein